MEFIGILNSQNYPSKSLDFTGTASATSAWPSSVDGVILWSTQPCYVAIGVDAVADSSSIPLPSYTVMPIKLPKTDGSPWVVSAKNISGTSSDGTLYILPVVWR